MAGHHIVPRFHLARWANPAGLIEVYDCRELEVREQDPKQFYTLPAFNRMEGADGKDDPWLEHQFLGTLDSDAARIMRQLENAARPRAQVQRIKKEGWHPRHVLSPKSSVRFAMYVAAQMVRSPAWRDAVKAHTASAMKRFVEDKTTRALKSATDPAEIARLRGLLGLRYCVADISGNLVPHLSGHLAYRLGEVLYYDYTWAVHRFEKPVLLLGDDPVLIVNLKNPEASGSYSQIATVHGEALSVYQDVAKLADDAVDVLRGSDLAMLPLSPQHMLVLAKIEHLQFPARYDRSLQAATGFNLLMGKASQRWLTLPPGNANAVRTQIAEKYPWRTETRATA